jgi:hypothetical protein
MYSNYFWTSSRYFITGGSESIVLKTNLSLALLYWYMSPLGDMRKPQYVSHGQFPAIFSSLLLFYSLPILFKIRTRDYFPFLICCSVGDLKKSHYGSHVSDHMSWIYNDMLNTVVTFFDQSDCSVHRMQSSLIQVFIVSQFIWCCIWEREVIAGSDFK